MRNPDDSKANGADLAGSASAKSAARKRSFLQSSVHLGVAGLTLARVRGENGVSYKYEDYSEDGGRIHIQTHGVLFNTQLSPWLALKGSVVYDGITGATPLGAPPLPGESTVATATIEDYRRGGFIEPAIKVGKHTFTPQVAYSTEEDYESVGLSLTHSIELNEKNTTLSWGISHSFDKVLPNPGESISEKQRKDSTDAIIGISQLLGPKTVLGLNFTLGYSDGYLSDPYKRVVFDDFPYFGGPYTVFPENRPDHKLKEVVDLSLDQALTTLRSAVGVNYRFHHDDFGISAHTVTLEYRQKITKYVTASPLFRFHTQTAAHFYATHFPGEPENPDDPIPWFYSSDYRLSALNSYTFGIGVRVHVHEHASIDFAYKRYIMEGTDGITVADQYPKAHVFTAGLNLWF